MQIKHLTMLVLGAVLAAAGGCGSGSDISPTPTPDTRAEALLKQMTFAEKIQLVHGAGLGTSPLGGAGYIPGIPRLGIPDINISDSSAGVNIANSGATALPSPLALAASWDPTLAHDYGARVGAELRTLGFVEGLGGAIALSRDPRNGVANENMGEDPVLMGLMSAQRSIGTQANKVIATVKQLALYDQQTNRFGLNVIADERTQRELYLYAFEIAVKEGNPGNVMCAYNQTNGQQACQDPYIFKALKTDWGFPGITQSDWLAAITDTVAAANAGLDEEEPGSSDDSVVMDGYITSHFNQKLAAAVQAGTVSQSRVDDMVRRKLRTLYAVGIMDSPPTPGGTIDSASGNALAQHVAEQSVVLLKNSAAGGSPTAPLPLSAASVRSILVVGGHADVGVISGGGSGGAPAQNGNPVTCLKPSATVPGQPFFSACATYYKSSPVAAIQALAPNATVTYLDGTNAAVAASAAASADVTIVFGTQWAGEGMDLASLSLPDQNADPANQAYDQNALITAVAAKAKSTVVVLESNSAVAMPWINSVGAVVEAWYPGVQGGPAIANVLFGVVNPSGKLPVTFPVQDLDMPQAAISASATSVTFSEGLDMGYRWYDAKSIQPLFPFGHGLSYTTFSFSNANAVSNADNVTVSVSLKNTGKVSGAQVAEVYAALPASAGEPPQRLVGWQKLTLAAGASTTVTITIPRSRFAVWNVSNETWQVPSGATKLTLGGSSRDSGAATASVVF